MHCARCGASLIEGLDRCYRCRLAAQPARGELGFDDAPFTFPSRAARGVAEPGRRDRPSRQTRRPSFPLRRGAAGLAFALAALAVLDFAAGDDALILLFAALHVLAGVALLRQWRGARAGAILLASLDAFLALVAAAGGVLGASAVVGACAVGMLLLLTRRAGAPPVRPRGKGARS